MKIRSTVFFLSLFGASSVTAAGNPVTYEVNGVRYEGYYAAAGTTAPLVLMIHDWDGLNAYEVKRSEMLAELGYSVFAADLFGAGVRPASIEEKRKQTQALYDDRQKMRALMKAALKTAQSKGADVTNAVAVGYCFGGADLKGFVTFHGGLATPEGQDYSKTKGKVLVMHGTADTAVTMEDFANLAVAMESRGVAHEMITYSGAPHAFTVFGGDRYREDADRKSWRRFTEFLSETLK